MFKKFKMTRKVEFCDVDMGGVLYHGNYYKYLDSARVEALAEIGTPFKDFFKSGTALVVVSIDSKFMAPAFFADELNIESEITALGRTSVTITQKIYKHERPAPDHHGGPITLHSSTIVLAHVSIKEMKAVPLPNELIHKMKLE